jgi:hypothetical protein
LAYKKEECEAVNPTIIIRDETPDDVCAITEVAIAAFKTLEISNHTEHFIIEALRAAKALTVSLVAEMDGQKLEIASRALFPGHFFWIENIRQLRCRLICVLDRKTPHVRVVLDCFARGRDFSGLIICKSSKR